MAWASVAGDHAHSGNHQLHKQIASGGLVAISCEDAAEEPEGQSDRKCHCEGQQDGIVCGGQKLHDPWAFFAWSLIEFNRSDAKRVRKGEPTVNALQARAWFAAERLDPKRSEWEAQRYPCSFQWCCDVLSVDGLIGRPLSTPEYYRHRWLREIAAHWAAAKARFEAGATPKCTATRANGKPCEHPAIEGDALCRHHRGAINANGTVIAASGPAEQVAIPEAQPQASDATAGRALGAPPISDDDLPDVVEGEVFLHYHAWCRRLGVSPASPERWRILTDGRGFAEMRAATYRLAS